MRLDCGLGLLEDIRLAKLSLPGDIGFMGDLETLRELDGLLKG